MLNHPPNSLSPPLQQGKIQVTRYTHARILRDHQLKEEDLWVSGKKIILPQTKADETIDVKGLIIAPGYIDLQINGGFGCDFTTQPENVIDVAKELPKFGVTSFLPTVVTTNKEQYGRCLPLLQPQEGGAHGAHILGIHLEGPFFNVQCAGAHETSLLRNLENMEIEEFYSSLEGVKIVTLAPEIPGARQAIEFLKKRHIIASAGHTLATYADMREGFQQGISFATHLFNAMRPMHQREPGAIAAILTNKNLFYSIIADGIHLHPATLELAWRAHPEGLVLITDAINALGLKHGKYQLGSKEIEVRSGKAYISNSTILAGSILSMDAAVRNFKSSVRCSTIAALEAASLKPAQVLGMQHIKGSLAFGADADFNILNDELYVQACYINGLRAYHS